MFASAPIVKTTSVIWRFSGMIVLVSGTNTLTMPHTTGSTTAFAKRLTKKKEIKRHLWQIDYAADPT
jgi:hypothetical protein